jgi:hypothetical protein
MKYIPILLWWILSNIIPMRPSEFLLIPFNCIENTDDGKFWVTIPRIKDDKESPVEIISFENLRYQTFQITKEVFNIIAEFKLRLQTENIESDFLISLDFYKTTYEINSTRGNAVENRINSNQFRQLLKKFNKNIVVGLYNERYEMDILPSHTRHFAIINMFLQGFNLLSIASLAGHVDLHSSENYYSHAKNFAKSYVYNFVSANLGSNISRKMSDGFIGWRRNVIDTGKMFTHNDITNFLKVDHGYCKDVENFPNNCGEHCQPCPHFIFKPDLNDYNQALIWLENYSSNLDQNIDITLETMINTSRSLSEHFTPHKEESFLSASRELQAYLDHKIRTDILLAGLKD